MQLVYSVFSKQKSCSFNHQEQPKNEVEMLRLQAYLSICKKYETEIKAIQQWMPDWEPAFMLKG